MKAIILAAGLGTRLRPLTNSIPKVMLPVRGKPLLEHIIGNLKEYGIKDLGINLHYLPDKITSYFHDGTSMGVSITYMKESELQGTSGGINKFRNWIGEDDFMVIYGDNYFSIDYSKLLGLFRESNNNIGTICVQHTKRLIGKGLVIVSNNNIVTFIEKPDNPERFQTDLTNSGIYVFRNKILEYIPKELKSDFGSDIFPLLLKDRQNLSYYVLDNPVIDIGTIEAYNSLK